MRNEATKIEFLSVRTTIRINVSEMEWVVRVTMS